MRKNRQPTPNGRNRDTPTFQEILETMTVLQQSNKEFRKQSKDGREKRKKLTLS